MGSGRFVLEVQGSSNELTPRMGVDEAADPKHNGECKESGDWLTGEKKCEAKPANPPVSAPAYN